MIINYLELIDMVTVRTLERPGLGKMTNFVLEVFVSQMKDHGLLADLFLTHQTTLQTRHMSDTRGSTT